MAAALKTRTMFNIREWVPGQDYSKPIGNRLWNRSKAARIQRLLRKQGRDTFLAPIRVTTV